ncbi:MAG: tetratricopeptide repeat protein [Candidatus Schekmanbacteria bacterium]|nr:MAG: tetratricopeptide repeat protein [Candidatus Schekmanbacteria bacterium]
MNRIIRGKEKIILFLIQLTAIFFLFFIISCNKFASFGKAKNLIIITMDTTRADALECYGNKNVHTPNINRIAQEGILFSNAASAAPITLPSHSSIMTGLFPINHGARDNSIYILPEENTTLAEVFKEKGFNTAGIVSTFILDSQYGINQGFDFFDDKFLNPEQKGRLPVQRKGIETATVAIDWLEENAKKKPFFMWVHFYDPHADYNPPEPYKTAYIDNLYLGEVAYTDMCIGMIIKELKKLDLYDDTLFVITADHGESLGEHGEQTHGIFIYDGTIHVPLIIRDPTSSIRGKKIDTQVRLVDIFPTVLELMGIDYKGETDGVSVAGFFEGKEVDENPSYCEAEIPKSFYWNALKGIRFDGWKYIFGKNKELYNLKDDPSERINLIEKESSKAKQLFTILKRIVANKRTFKKESNIKPLDEETIEKLKALGYFQAGGTSGKEEEYDELPTEFSRPDPLEQIKNYRKFQRINNLIDSKQYDAAEKGLKEIIKEDPENPRFLSTLAEMYKTLDRIKEAIPLYEKAAKFDPKNGRYYFLIGNLYNRIGKPSKAIEFYKKTVQLNPRHFLAHYNLGRFYTLQGDYEKAILEYETALKLRPDHSYSYNNLAYIYMEKLNDKKKGLEYLKKAVKASPNIAFIRKNYASALIDLGKYKEAEKEMKEALRLEPNNPKYYTELGNIYKKMGDLEKAQEMWKKSTEISSSKEGSTS